MVASPSGPPGDRPSDADAARLFELPFDVMGVASFDGVLRRVNPGIERVLGLTPKDVVGRKLLDMCHPDDREATAEAFGAVLEGGEVSGFENRLPTADGSYKWLQWNVLADVDEGLIYGVARDVTDRRNLEHELRESQRELEASHDALRARAEEQAALRRVATLVAREASPSKVFGAVAEQVAGVLDTEAIGMLRFEPDGTATLVAQSPTPWDPPPLGSRFTLDGENVIASVLRTGQAARVDDWTNSTGMVAGMATALGIRSAVATPIVGEGRLWGTMIAVTSQSEPLPPDTESRIAEFTELVATAIANAEARGELSRLAEEQAALRRVATLVAHQASQADIFTAVAEELGRILGVDDIRMVRYEDDEDSAEAAAVVLATWGALVEVLKVGERHPLGGENVISRVFRTGGPARIDDYTAGSGAIGNLVREGGVGCAVAAPITVEGRLWGAVVAGSLDQGTLPSDTDARLSQFTDLMGNAIANAEARAEVARLANEQAALRRVATLVAEESPAADLFGKVAEEVASLLGDHVDSAILRYESDETATVVGVWGEQPPGGIRVDARLPVDGSGVTAQVFRERRPVRVDDYTASAGAIADHAREHGIRSAVGCPILVQGRLWGAMVVAHYEAEPFPADTERRVSQFTELMATAIANAKARDEVQRLADEQAALRRVATLVAEGAAPTDVFEAVSVEVARLLGAAQVGLARYEDEREMSILAMHGDHPAVPRAGMRLPLEGDSVTTRVFRTGRSARINYDDEGSGDIAEFARRSNVTVTVGAPITVEGRLWGVIPASWEGQELPPVDAEERLARFAELLDTAVANADTRDQLTASRARVLTAGDEARMRVVRDLHDGAQQRLVHTIVTLKLAQQALHEDGDRAESLLAEALDHAVDGNAELRELAHGILPSVLTRGGLLAGVDAVVSRLDLEVHVDVTTARLAPEIEASAYFTVAEALTNVVKHSKATSAEVTAVVRNGWLRVEVRDDGIGGADPDSQGLLGLGDRVAALGGRLRIESPPGAGTVVTAELPLST
jgi:PAS domain S-box-containing protein